MHRVFTDCLHLYEPQWLLCYRCSERALSFEGSGRTRGDCRGLFRCTDFEWAVGTEERHEHKTFDVAVTVGIA